MKGYVILPFCGNHFVDSIRLAFSPVFFLLYIFFLRLLEWDAEFTKPKVIVVRTLDWKSGDLGFGSGSCLESVGCFCLYMAWCSLYEEPGQESMARISHNNIILMVLPFLPSFLHLLWFCSCGTTCIVSILILYFITRLKSLGKIFIFSGSWFLYLYFKVK